MEGTTRISGKETYEAPSLFVVGTIHELTQGTGSGGNDQGGTGRKVVVS